MPQILDYSKRTTATQADILIAFRDRLITACPGLTDLSCFISDQPIPNSIPGGGHCVTVSMGDGTFDQQLFTGGGIATLCEESQIIVTVLSQIVLDRIPQAEKSLLDEDRGLIANWKRNILQTLLLDDPSQGTKSKQWEPAKNDKPLCRNLPRPTHASSPGDVPGKAGWIGAQITFAVEFDWDLS